LPANISWVGVGQPLGTVERGAEVLQRRWQVALFDEQAADPVL
jgi:hypothetical protein